MYTSRRNMKRNIEPHIYWKNPPSNPDIFVYDYHHMKDTKWRLHDELIQTLSHPKNISKFAGWGFIYLF